MKIATQPKQFVHVRLTDVSMFCRQLLAYVHVEPPICDSWMHIALQRDMVGDFARGIARLPTIMERLHTGDLTPTLTITVEHLSLLSARITAPTRHWPDQVGQHAARLAGVLAQQHGIGLVACSKPNILGAALRPLVDAELLGVMLVQNAPLLASPFTAENVVGNNPVAICGPGNPPFLFDGALSQYSLAPLVQAAQYGEPLPPGAVLTARGHSTDDPQVVRDLLQGKRECGGLAPLGGLKGFGLAMGIELLAGALTGGFAPAPVGKSWGEGALILAFSGRLFNTPDMADRIRTYLRQFDTYPGKHAWEQQRANEASGVIAYPIDTIAALNHTAQEYSLARELVPC